MTIRVFVTGGTFDKEYNEITGELYFRGTHLSEMLTMGRSKLDVQIRTLMMIDSLEMSDNDRKIILENVQRCDESRVVITHGTDTMENTAQLLGKHIFDKTVVLMGAMIPIAFGSSDGLFNLGSALAFAQSLPHGVYVVMNGRCFPHDNVRKNRTLGEFERIY